MEMESLLSRPVDGPRSWSPEQGPENAGARQVGAVRRQKSEFRWVHDPRSSQAVCCSRQSLWVVSEVVNLN